MQAAAMTTRPPLKNAKAAVKAVGIMEPPRNPCRARNTIMLWIFQAQPQSRLVSVEPRADTQKSQRVDITRDSQPDRGKTMISASRQLVWTQASSSAPADRPPPISLR